QGEGKTASIPVLLADEAKRDELLEGLTARLGPDWDRREEQIGWLRSGGLPLGLAAVAGFFTLVMYDEAEQIASGKQLKAGGGPKGKLVSTIMHWVEEMIGSTGVLILGGLLIALCLGWFVYAVVSPGVRITVQPRSQG